MKKVLLVCLCCCFCGSYSSLIPSSVNLCGPETTIGLASQGINSSMILHLAGDYDAYCKLHVTAPKTHVVNLQIIESNAEIKKALLHNDNNNNKSELHLPPCTMSIYLPDNPKQPFWKGDLCSSHSILELDLLTSDFRIVWTPPFNLRHVKGRRILITAVGNGPVCKESGQHTCMKIGRVPVFCVSDHLLCDGYQNCPKNSVSSDEDDQMCKSNSQVYIEQLAMEIFKKLKMRQEITENNNNIDKWSQQQQQQQEQQPKSTNNWKVIKKIEIAEEEEEETTTLEKKATDSISQMLSKYGPWGYLMLGLLICGTVLMFCGLWECCCRKPKDPALDTSVQSQPTTVLIINQSDDGGGNVPNPPNYDDLDQPPSYTTLFPHSKLNMPCSSFANSMDNSASANADNNIDANCNVGDNASIVTIEQTNT